SGCRARRCDVHELLAVIKKELQQLRRDKKVIPAMVLGPIIQLLALGYAANLDVLNVPLLLVDQDRSEASRDLVDRFLASGYFDLMGPRTARRGSIPGCWTAGRSSRW